jgi:hypothetical protein
MALNAPLGSNNVLALAASVSALGRGEAGIVDTGEPTAVNSPPGTIVKVGTFPLNGVGIQPQVARGGWALVVKAVNAATTVGNVVIVASDGVNSEQVGAYQGTGPVGQGCCYAEPFNTSITAGVDKGAITNVVTLSASVTLTTGTGATIMFAAVGGP